jgi:hypothetical protein
LRQIHFRFCVSLGGNATNPKFDKIDLEIAGLERCQSSLVRFTQFNCNSLILKNVLS